MTKKILIFTALLIPTFSYANLVDELILEPTGNATWQTETVTNHDMWQKPACVASTQGSDESSYLEVVAFYDAETDSFQEPFVSVVSPFDVSFFEVVARTDRNRETFRLLPAVVEGSEMVGARALFDDRENFVKALRARNSVSAQYLDSEGVIKEVTFSLRGSSKAIAAQFEACSLEFLDISEVLETELTQELQ